jgi:hypothetical protein
VVARHAEGVPRGDHAHGEAQNAGSVRAAVDEVAEEDGLPAVGVDRADGGVGVVLDRPAEPGEQRAQLGRAAVDVPDDVEGSVDLPAVVPGPLAHNLDGVDLVGPPQHVDPAEALLAEAPKRPLKVAMLAGDDVAAEVAVGPEGVSLDGDRLGDVDDDGVDENVVALRELDQCGAGRLLDVGRVDDCEQTAAQSSAHDVVEDVEGVRSGRLVVLVVRDQAAAEVAGDDLGGLEVGARERRLAAARDPDEDDQTHGGNGDLLPLGCHVSHRLPPLG